MNEETDTERSNNFSKVNGWAGIWTQAIWIRLYAVSAPHWTSSPENPSQILKSSILIKYHVDKNTKWKEKPAVHEEEIGY